MEHRTLHAFIIGPDTYIAYDEDDAWACMEEQTGIKRDSDDYEGEVAVRVADDMPLRILLEEGRPEAETKTAAEWCAQEGRGFLCSTEY
jgi:hypothetical protein